MTWETLRPDTGHDPLTLTAGFIAAHPVTAARTLEAIDPNQAVALLQDLPSRVTAPLLEAMLPAYAGLCLQRLPMAYTRALLQRLPSAAGALALRQVAEPVRGELLAELPRTRRSSLQRLLRYPAETVGAWMNPEAPVLPESANVAAAVRHCRQWSGPLDGAVYLVDDGQRLAGLLHPGELLRADAAQPVRSLARAAPPALSARDTLIAARAQVRGRTDPEVPVTDRSGRFLGVLQRAVLMRATRSAARRRGTAPPTGVAGDLLAAYWLVVKSLVGLGLGGERDAGPRR